MPERLYQYRFDGSPLDVTPKGFRGLGWEEAQRLSRFVREAREGTQIKSPADAAQYLTEKVYTHFEDFEQEEFWTLLLDTRNRVTYEVMVYRGTINSIHIREAELFKEPIRLNAPALILSHIHPSGDPSPSPEDVHVTHDANQAAKLLGIDLLDHIIVGKDAWVSLKEKGLGF